MSNLLKEFQDMKLEKIFEIELENEYYDVYYIVADEKGLYAGTITNIGFKQCGDLFITWDDLFITWDDNFSLDEHLQELYSLCVDFSYER